MARKKKHADHENHERWLVSYADFITLLFAFFVVMFAISQVDSQKLGRFVQSMQAALELGGPFPPQGPDPIGSDGASVQAPPAITSLAVELTPRHEQAGRSPETERDSLTAVKAALSRYLTRPEIRGRVRTMRDRRGLTLSLTDSGLFAPGSEEILQEALPGLARLGELLREINVQALVEGHTDDGQMESPRFPTNWDLSAARAVAVIRYLVDREHVAPYRFAAVGYGPYRPLAPNDTPEGRARNRRVDLVLLGIDPLILDLDGEGLEPGTSRPGTRVSPDRTGPAGGPLPMEPSSAGAVRPPAE